MQGLGFGSFTASLIAKAGQEQELREVGGVEYTAEEKKLAEKIRKTFDNPRSTLESANEIQPYDRSLGYGSTDVGDVSYAAPTVGVRTATWAPGTSAHSWQAVAASGTSIGFKGAQVAAKALTLAAIELYENPELREAAKEEFDEARGENYKYQSLLGDRKPPLDYRK